MRSLRKDARHLHRVRDVRLPGLAILSAVRVVRQRQRLPHLMYSRGHDVQGYLFRVLKQSACTASRCTCFCTDEQCWLRKEHLFALMRREVVEERL